jgi:hypothetical protein
MGAKSHAGVRRGAGCSHDARTQPLPSSASPHATGYFRTVLTRFDLVPQANGGTQIVEHTSHVLKLDPVLYWLPMTRWIVHLNNTRVLRHVKRQAEAAAASPARTDQ